VGSSLPAVSYSGLHGECKVTVVCNGKDAASGVDSVGTVCAALTTMAAIQAVQPDLVINAGTAGGFKVRVCVSSGYQKLHGSNSCPYRGRAARPHPRFG
jgi:hypothetical protein